ncbi:MAG TPA: cation-transporting P-type ATPase [Candidatus Paceibacterota bacterium]|nr:cation-transporting P-type ATPase [Candidatus Paceibacterota bacterium]
MSSSANTNKNLALQLNQSELIAHLQTSHEGLSQKEAEKRLLEHGSNVIGKKTANALGVLGRQLKSSLVYLLVIASLISYGIRDYTDGTVILVILLINTFLGFYQEYKSEKIIEKLSQLITKQVRLKRDGKSVLLDESQIVPGDVLTVREGDIVPADMRLLEVDYLQVNESQLTGESVPIIKRVSTASNATPETLLYTGSSLEKGVGTGVVYATGRDTGLGTIAKLSTETKKQTQYEKSVQAFSVLLMRVVLIVVVLVFITKLLLNSGSNITELLLFVIALAVSTVPEVLPVITTVTLSSGAMKLVKRHVVVRRLSSLEDLGNVSLLCTDKTGTLTENKMVIHSIASDDDDLFQKLMYATITPLKGRKRRSQNSYDDAFLNYIPEHVQREARGFSIIKEIPFDPDARRNRIILEDAKHHMQYLVVVGAPEILMGISISGKKLAYSYTLIEEGKSGLHHLALAYKEITYRDDLDILKHEHGLHFLGYASLEDPLRPSTKITVQHAEKLGIKIKVLTGDSREVAGYVGKQIGLVQENERVYIGDELEAMSPEEFSTVVLRSNVFARVSPTQKFNIIAALKKEYVVAYQGDGINDAPALKLADVAIAVNTATDIAKESADIVLLNKSLEVIVNGIKYGRSVFVNINKYIKYTMLNNFGMLISLSVLYLSSAALPLLPVQVLLNNLIGDVPLITVSSDTVDDEEVVRPERQNSKELMFLALALGIPTALFELLYFLVIHTQPEKIIQTSLYAFFTLQALIIFYAVRNKDHFWKAQMPSGILNISFLLAFVFSLTIIYLPTFQTWFSFVPLSTMSIAIMVIFTIIYFLATDFVKVLYYRRSMRNGSQAIDTAVA